MQHVSYRMHDNLSSSPFAAMCASIEDIVVHMQKTFMYARACALYSTCLS